MLYLDRTKEFLSIVNLEKNQFYNPLDSPTAKITQKESSSSKVQLNSPPQSEFQKEINHVNREIFKTSHNLEKLSDLIKQRNPFDECRSSIEKYTVLIKQQIVSIEYEVNALEEKFVKTSSFNHIQEKRHYEQIIKSVKSILWYENKQFISLMKCRKKVMKRQKKRRQKFLTETKFFDSTEDLISPVRSCDNLLLRESPEIIENNDDVVIHVSDDEKTKNKMMLSQEMIEIQRTDTRTDEVQKISKNIAELSTMFDRLSVMVVSHKELTQRIDSNVEDANANVESGHKELIKYGNTIGSNRGLILKVFFILILFVIFVGIFVIK